MSLSQEEIDQFQQMIHEANYAITKQIEGSSPDNGNYGTIDIYDAERDEYEKFLTDLMEKRVRELTKILEDNKKH